MPLEFPFLLEQNRSIELVCGIGYCIKQHCMMIILYQREIRRPPKPKPRPPPPPSSSQAFFFGLSFLACPQTITDGLQIAQFYIIGVFA